MAVANAAFQRLLEFSNNQISIHDPYFRGARDAARRAGAQLRGVAGFNAERSSAGLNESGLAGHREARRRFRRGNSRLMGVRARESQSQTRSNSPGKCQ